MLFRLYKLKVIVLISSTKDRDLSSFQGVRWLMKNTKSQTYSEPDVQCTGPKYGETSVVAQWSVLLNLPWLELEVKGSVAVTGNKQLLASLISDICWDYK